MSLRIKSPKPAPRRSFLRTLSGTRMSKGGRDDKVDGNDEIKLQFPITCLFYDTFWLTNEGELSYDMCIKVSISQSRPKP